MPEPTARSTSKTGVSVTEAARAGLGLRSALRMMRWELRGSQTRLLFWTLCLAVGVGAVVGVAGLGASLESALRSEARSLLAGDLAIRHGRTLPDDVLELLRETGHETATVREVIGGARRAEARDSGANSLMVGIKAVEGGYPFYGQVEIEQPLRDDLLTTPLQDVLESGDALVGRELLQRLGLGVGEHLLLGGERVRIVGVVASEPDRLPGTVAIGPRVLVHRRVLDASGITGFSGFARNKTLLSLGPGGDAEAAEQIAERLRAALESQSGVRVETFADAQPSLRRDLERMENYLGLAALLSLLIGGVGIAQGVSSWINTRIDSLAILKCLGTRPVEVFLLYLAQAVLLGLVGSLAGCLFGLVVLWGVPQLLSEFVPVETVRLWQPAAYLRGVALGVGVSIAFSVPPLLSVLRVPPSRVFRRTADPLPGSKSLPALAFLVSLLAIGALAALQSGSLLLAVLFVAGVAATVAALSGAAYVVSRGAGSLANERQAYWLRHGLSALSRPGAGTLGAIVALGLGLFVITTMSIVQAHLRAQIEGELPRDAPSAFLVDIRPEQWDGVEQTLREAGARQLDSVPVVRARITAIDGTAADELVRPDNRWALGREQRITYLAQIPDGNTILEGAWWSDDPERGEISLEAEYAETIGAQLGSTLTLRTGGQELAAEVTSLREVNWEGFGINFFLVAKPGLLDGAPQIRLASARLPQEQEQAAQDAVAEAYPNVLFVPIREMLDRILVLLGRLILGVRVLGGFVILSGLAILFGAVATSHAQRGREVALMKTLGMTRFDVLRAFSIEYALVGLAAAMIAVLGALVVSAFVVVREMEIAWTWQPTVLASVLLGGTALSVVAGTLASTRALARRPIESLREE